jgi:flagellar hook-associated protein 2
MATTAISSTSLSGLGLPGLSSGLDTTSIITKLMSIEAAPQTALKSTLTGTTAYRSALQALNTAVAGVATGATAAARPGALASFTATADDPAVTATAGSGAAAGSISFTVDRLAAAQVSVTAAMSSFDAARIGTLTVRTGAPGATRDTPITLTSGDLDSVVAAINVSGAGVTATKVAAGAVDGVAQYRLQLRSATGAAGAFSVSLGPTYTADASATLGLTQISAAQDAKLTLFSGTAASQPVTSATNTFAGVLTGVDITVSAVTATPATLSITPSTTAATAAAQSLTAGLVALFSGIASGTAISTAADSSGSTTGGVFTGDGSVRLLKDALLTAVSGPVAGRSPSSIGISLTKDGTISFDQSRFAAAMASDPAGTTAMFQTIAQRVSTAATAASDPSTGTTTLKIASAQSTEASLTKQIGDWDTRLAAIQLQYTKQFNDLETALSALNSQASYLTSQLSGLTTDYQSTK